MNLFGKDKELRELRSQVKSGKKTKRNPIDKVKARLKEFTAETHRPYEPQPSGLKLWWVLGYKGDEEKIDGPHYSASEADRKLATYDDGEIFELRNVTKKSEAKEEIKRILKERQKEEEEFLKGRMALPQSEEK